MNADVLLAYYERIVEVPDAVARLRHFVLDLAVRGRLEPQNSQNEPAQLLLERNFGLKAKLGLRVAIDAQNLTSHPFELPSGWTWTTVGEVCSKTGSGSTPRGGQAVYKNAGIPFLRSQNVYDDGLRIEDVAYIDKSTHARMAGTAVKPGDLLLNITGGSIGRCCRIPEEFAGANVSQHVAILRPVIGGMQEFLHVLIRSPYFQSFVTGEQTGAGRGGLPKNRMDRISVALPPLAEQHRIVAKVDRLTLLCDQLQSARTAREVTRDRLAAVSLARLNTPDGETFPLDARFTLAALPALTTRPDQIKHLRQTILNLAVRGKLVPQDESDQPIPLSPCDTEQASTELPSFWRYVRLGNLLREDTRNGYSRRPDDAADGVPILRISAGTVRRDGLVAEEEHKLISGIDARTRKEYGLEPSDLLACRFNGNKAFVGRLTIFRDYLGLNPIYPDKLIRVRANPEFVLPEFLRAAGESDLVRAEVEAHCATTVGNWGISASNLKNVRYPVAPVAEQRRIVAKLDELMVLCDALEASLTAAATTGTRLLEAILHEVLQSTAEMPILKAAE